MSREIIQEALNGIRDEYITEAGARLGLLAVGAAGAVGAASGAAVDPSTLYSLSGTQAAAKAGFGAWLAKGGWIALVAGVVVAAGVAAGVFFFGKSGDMPPVGTGEVTTAEKQGSLPSENETENPDYAGETQKEVTVRHGDTVINPRKFFLYDGVADGLGFEQEIKQYHNNQPNLPKVYYAKDGSISPCDLILAEGYEFSFVRIYNEHMIQDSAVTYDGSFNYRGFLSVLPTGTYYVALQIKHGSSGHEYAYELVVVDTQAELDENESESESETETPTEPEVSRYLQVPLTDPNDTASYVSLPDLSAEGYPKLAFFTPVGEENTLREVFTLPISTKGEQNILVLLCEGIIDPSYQTGSSYFMLYFVESTFVEEVDGTEQRTVQMRCGRVDFYDTPMPVPSGDSVSYTHYHVDKTASASVTYSEANRDRVLASNRHNNLSVLDQADELLFEYGKETYELTVLYSSMNGVETVHTPVESLPDFPYELFRTHALP